MEGLAKFAHLISLEFFDDLVTVLHQMIEQDVSELFNFILLAIKFEICIESAISSETTLC